MMLFYRDDFSDYFDEDAGLIRYRWEKWFAWYPVSLEDGGWVWLKTVQAQDSGHGCIAYKRIERMDA